MSLIERLRQCIAYHSCLHPSCTSPRDVSPPARLPGTNPFPVRPAYKTLQNLRPRVRETTRRPGTLARVRSTPEMTLSPDCRLADDTPAVILRLNPPSGVKNLCSHCKSSSAQWSEACCHRVQARSEMCRWSLLIRCVDCIPASATLPKARAPHSALAQACDLYFTLVNVSLCPCKRFSSDPCGPRARCAQNAHVVVRASLILGPLCSLRRSCCPN